ncbi:MULTISPECIES: hypothetical protein [unclassified Bradyrhizobium]|uniref:hypothetical protein n=1 Tax=unclassified Bradyrhizobium TaxID=2631580 RepID=UPI0028EE410C|nr:MULTISPECIES: hypothetical protein [unclassified Bradyrhizobium]
MTDNIASLQHHHDLFPLLGKMERSLDIIFEFKPTSKLTDLERLGRAGVRTVQMGIETLSTRLLHLLSKGGSARQNILALRNAPICGVQVIWNFLHRILKEEEADYERMISLTPAIVHLEPPRAVIAVSMDRFSPLFDQPASYGITNMRPKSVYAGTYPARADLMNLAYHFDGDYPACDDAASGVLGRIFAEIDRWRKCWDGPERPRLTIIPLEEEFLLIDTRQQGNAVFLPLNHAEARFALLGREENNRARDFCVDHGLVIEIDGSLVPVAVADSVTTARLEASVMDG